MIKYFGISTLFSFSLICLLGSPVWSNICVPEPGEKLKVVGVASDDTLNVRKGYTTKYRVVTELLPNQKSIEYVDVAYKSEVCSDLCAKHLAIIQNKGSIEASHGRIESECRSKSKIWYKILSNGGTQGWTSAKYLDGYLIEQDSDQRENTENSELVYVVVKGDTAYSISRKYEISLNELASLNNLDTNYSLKLGQTLVLSTNVAKADESINEEKMASGPSFDCRRATTPGERSICENPTLVELENVVSDAFEQVKKNTGENTARILERLYLESRRQCGVNGICIEKVQREAINRFIALGAEVNFPPAFKGYPPPAQADQLLVAEQAASKQEEVKTFVEESPSLDPLTVANSLLQDENSSQLIVLLVLVSFGIVFILAVTGHLIIYNDGGDLALNLGITLIPLAVFVYIASGAPSEDQGQAAIDFYNDQSWVLVARIGSIAACVGCALGTTWISIRENGFLWGLLVALIKIFLSIFAVFFVILWISVILYEGETDPNYSGQTQYERDRDKPKRDRERRRKRVIIFVLLAGLIYALVNGNRVRNRREKTS
ncbi:LysM peptidoglycan-binding domain-containing protein [Amylibacter sp.]|nr:LysM peptidoglycan-binding domain-containing protein [Amylibacter sp.]